MSASIMPSQSSSSAPFAYPASLPGSSRRCRSLCGARPRMVFTPQRPVVHVDWEPESEIRSGTRTLNEEAGRPSAIDVTRELLEVRRDLLHESDGADNDRGMDANNEDGEEKAPKKRSWWVGRKHTEETKQKIGRANRGKVPWNRGKVWSAEVRRKIALGTQRAMRRPEMIERLRLRASLRRHDQSAKERIRLGTIRAAARRRDALITSGCFRLGGLVNGRMKMPFPLENETIEMLKKSIDDKMQTLLLLKRKKNQVKPRGLMHRPMSETTKEKLRERIRKMWEDPGYRARVKAGRKNSPHLVGRKLTEEHKDKISATLRRRYAANPITRKGRGVRTKKAKTEEEIEEQRLRRLQRAGMKKQQAERDLQRLKRKRHRALLRAARRRRREAERTLAEQERKVLFKSLKEAGVLPPLEGEGDDGLRESVEELTNNEGPRELSSYRLFHSVLDTDGLALSSMLKFETYTHREKTERRIPKHVRRVVRYVDGKEIIEEEERLTV